MVLFARLLLAAVLATSLLAASCPAAEKSTRELLPASLVAVLEIPRPATLVNSALDHPLAALIEQSPELEAAKEKPEFGKLRDALRRVEAKLGASWREALSTIAAGGATVGFDLPTQGVAILLEAKDHAAAEKARDAALDLARAAAAEAGQADPVREEVYRGLPFYRVGDGLFAVLGRHYLVTNKTPLLQMVLENHLGEGQQLLKDQQFQAVLKQRPADPSAWLYVDLRVLRLLGVLRSQLQKKSDNPLGELLLGGVLTAIPDAPYMTASLEFSPQQLRLAVELPCKPKEAAKSKAFFLGPEAAGVAPPLLAPQHTLLSLSAYRDFASLWRNAPDLFNDAINAKFAEAESGLTTLFSGKNFREDILGNLEPGIQIVAVRQTFAPGQITPAIQLPAGALVVRLKNPEETARHFKITFQSLIGFLNVVGAMNGLDPLDLNTEKQGDALVVSAEYLPPKAELRAAAPLHFNASPTAAFVGDQFILSSTKQLAVELAEQLRKPVAQAAGINTRLVIENAVVEQALQHNREPLVAQNMLQRGHDKAAAEAEVRRALAVLGCFERLNLQLSVEAERLVFAFDLGLRGK